MSALLAVRPMSAADTSLSERAQALDLAQLSAALDSQGGAVVAGLLNEPECRALAASYEHEQVFRSRVVMARHGFGRGEYRYFAYPLPPIVAALRATFYSALVPLANRWNERMGSATRYPPAHADFLARCHAAGQGKPTPLLLKYTAGDYNCLHQDLYGEHVFPLQVALLLSQPAEDFSGGEFIMTEQRPRMQTRGEVFHLRRGDAVIFAVHQRPVQGTRGVYRVSHRHGVSRLHSGQRYTLGVIFHDAL